MGPAAQHLRRSRHTHTGPQPAACKLFTLSAEPLLLRPRRHGCVQRCGQWRGLLPSPAAPAPRQPTPAVPPVWQQPWQPPWRPACSSRASLASSLQQQRLLLRNRRCYLCCLLQRLCLLGGSGPSALCVSDVATAQAAAAASENSVSLVVASSHCSHWSANWQH